MHLEVLAHMGYELLCLTMFLLVSALKFHCKSIREKTDCAACYHITFSLLLWKDFTLLESELAWARTFSPVGFKTCNEIFRDCMLRWIKELFTSWQSKWSMEHCIMVYFPTQKCVPLFNVVTTGRLSCSKLTCLWLAKGRHEAQAW